MMEYDKIRVMIHIFYKIGGDVMRILDISCGMLTTPIYPGDPEPRLQRILMRSHGKSALTESAAYEISSRGTRLIGTGALSIAAGGNDDQRKIHRAILGGGTAILEGLNMEKAEPGRYFLFAPPVKIEGVDGATPRRADRRLPLLERAPAGKTPLI